MKYWKKTTSEERLKRITKALQENVNFSKDITLGYPASKLDGRTFNEDASFLKDAPVLMTYLSNPNHIGCHTNGISEKAFRGTQQIEREVLDMVAIDIFKAKPGGYDGYIATGGTEANIEALWIYRNFFINNRNAQPSEIMIIASEDTHYSIAKGSNLLMIDWMRVPVDFETRIIVGEAFEEMLLKAQNQGKKYFIVVANMGTTMFGSVDDVTAYTDILYKHELEFKLHVDAAYGGFIYPFLAAASKMDFLNENVSSITIDAHKILQAPYGTGIFICRKDLIENVLTQEAGYVEGMDLTLCGSRSGANAVAVWMILKTYGENDWFEKVKILQMRTDWLCIQLSALKIRYFREPYMNIVAIKSDYIPEDLAHKYHLVPQTHTAENHWYKIVLMEHVDINGLEELIADLEKVAVI